MLLAVGGVAAACGQAPEDALSTNAQELTGGNQCDGVQLDASRFYRPRSRTDAVVQLSSGSLTFQVPSSIAVTAGRADHGKAKFAFKSGNATTTVCVYRGNGSNAYTFVRCRVTDAGFPDVDDDDDDNDRPDGPCDPLPTAGSTVTADYFALRVNRGDKRYGTTSVSVHLGGPTISDNNACTIDACTPASGISHTPIDINDNDDCTVDTCDPTAGVSHTLVDTPFCRGRAAFNDTELQGQHGNGRACSTCHVESDSFQLSPAHASARWDALQAARVTNPLADDPLFRAVDADDFRVNGQNASSFKNLKYGLVRVTYTLPSNVKLVGAGGTVTADTFVDVWRAVPSVNDVGITGPDGQLPEWPPVIPAGSYQRLPGQVGANVRGGFMIDARFGTLQEQAQDALFTHVETTAPAPTRFLDDLAAYQSTLTPPPEPPLTDFEQQGKTVFIRSCGQCHGGVGLSTPVLQDPDVRRYQANNAICPRVADSPTWCVASGGTAPCPPRFQHKACPPVDQVPGLAPKTFEITHTDTGHVFRRTSSDPGRFLTTGFVGSLPPAAPLPDRVAAGLQDFNVFDTPGLRGISRTAPYFHDNTALTLEEVLDHYDAFFTGLKINIPGASTLTTGVGRGQDRPFTPAERPALLAFLRRL